MLNSLHMMPRFLLLLVAVAAAFCCPASAEDAVFFRGINLNGPPVTIDGRAWDGKDAKDFSANGKTFENQQVALRPPTEAGRAQMIRSSVWGDKVDIELRNVPDGAYQIFLYVWEDNHNERFNVLVSGKIVVEAFESGTAGMWKKLGPWPARADSGKLTVSARAASHGAANLSGLEVWKGEGPIPASESPKFATAPTPEQLAFFESKVRPVLADHCYKCHSAKAEKIKGGLVLDSRSGVAKGGDNGAVITPGDPDASLLVQAIRHGDEDTAMPPKKKLAPEHITALEQWVKMGAPDPRTDDTVAVVEAKSAIDWDKARGWWSFKPLAAPSPPPVKDAAWPANDIDRFILARIEAAGLQPSADAEPRALIRRATYDLTGLPPTPEEVEAFVRDSISNQQSAISNLIDRLLASPRYGERWGRHWLDVVRYADTAGDNSDFPIPQMHRYRDWVIAAFNRDLPYDQFVREQLAGDLLGGGGDERLQRIVATGYIANARRFGSRVDDYPQHLTIEDTIDNLGRTFLGLTVNCARCHDHKFDPISAQDYYALYGIFHSTRYPWPGIELDQKQRDLVPLVAPEKLADAEGAKKSREQEQARLDKEVQKLKDELKKVADADKKAHEEKIKAAENAAADLKKQPLPFETAYAVAESAKIGDVALQLKGDPAKPGATVPRRFLTVLGGAALPPEERGSGRRELAEWIVARDNPLTARVMANRIWQHHFGRGIVPTPNDFGKQGKPPTHPELLDFLAAKFRDGGWSVKALHREILLSRTYRLATTRSADSLARDPGNELLTAYPRLRLDAEAIRDTLLVLGANIDLTSAGAHPFPPQSEWKFTQHNPFKAVYDTNHRSVFLMTQRIQRHPYLAVFDGADPSASTAARPTSTTPLQALYLLNDPLVHEQSKRVAARLIADAPDDPARIARAYALLLSRPAARDEIDAARTFLTDARAKLRATGKAGDELERETWRAFVRVLFRLNEFVYPD
jgi:mono/diheme cytochrome c family protein